MENRDMEVLSDARISGEKYAFLPETLTRLALPLPLPLPSFTSIISF